MTLDHPLRRLLLGALAAFAIGPAAHAAADGATPEPPPPPPADASTLELPTGIDLAVVVFEDLQCPDCARVHPQLLAISKASKVPVVIHDFPITRHVWAFPAAILARWFAQQSPELGVEFRSHVFERQREILPDTLRGVAEAFARDHGQELPSQVDPDGKLMAAVQADFDLGRRIGLHYVPLVFVITRHAGWVEVTDVTQLEATVAEFRQREAKHRPARRRGS